MIKITDRAIVLYMRINPVAKPRMTRSDAWVSRRRLVRPPVQKYRDFRAAVQGELMQHRLPGWNRVGLTLWFHVWQKRRTRIDLSNMVKAFEDSIAGPGLLIRDDNIDIVPVYFGVCAKRVERPHDACLRAVILKLSPGFDVPLTVVPAAMML